MNCGSCIDVSGTGGTIQSLNYPLEYLDNSNCRYTITAVTPLGKKIKLKFIEFVLEDCGSSPCDVLSVDIFVINKYVIISQIDYNNVFRAVSGV